MGGLQSSERSVRVRVDGDYDYVDHATRKKRVVSLEQDAVHSTSIASLKHNHTGRLSVNWLELCDCTAAAAAHPVAQSVIECAKEMAQAAALEPDVLDKDWTGFKGKHPLLALLVPGHDAGTGDDSSLWRAAEVLGMLTSAVREIAEEEPVLLSAEAPAHIFGDLHGQFRDLLLWLQDFGFPQATGPTFVFNGDWVDRGAHQVETVALLFALKVVFPDKIMLVRGNHEFQDQNEFTGATGFKAACLQSLQSHGQQVFDSFQAAFNYLPVGCVVAEKILVVHGGIGNGDWDLEELEDVERPITCDNVRDNPHIYNILWSDPIPETVEHSFGVHDSPRDGHQHMIHQFGQDVTEAFCARNDLEAVVRSHQEKSGGCGYEVMHGSRLVRVFSARDYEGHQNDGAMLKVRWSKGGKLVIRPQVLRSLVKTRPAGETSTLAKVPFFNKLKSLERECCGINQALCGAGDIIELVIPQKEQYPGIADSSPGSSVLSSPRSLGSSGPLSSPRSRGGGGSPSSPRSPKVQGFAPGQAVRIYSTSQSSWVFALVESVGPDGSLTLVHNGCSTILEPQLIPSMVQRV